MELFVLFMLAILSGGLVYVWTMLQVCKEILDGLSTTTNKQEGTALPSPRTLGKDTYHHE